LNPNKGGFGTASAAVSQLCQITSRNELHGRNPFPDSRDSCSLERFGRGEAAKGQLPHFALPLPSLPPLGPWGGGGRRWCGGGLRSGGTLWGCRARRRWTSSAGDSGLKRTEKKARRGRWRSPSRWCGARVASMVGRGGGLRSRWGRRGRRRGRHIRAIVRVNGECVNGE
jgi:hypothetical protein